MFSYVVNYTDPTIAAMSSLFIGLTFAGMGLIMTAMAASIRTQSQAEIRSNNSLLRNLTIRISRACRSARTAT